MGYESNLSLRIYDFSGKFVRLGKGSDPAGASPGVRWVTWSACWVPWVGGRMALSHNIWSVFKVMLPHDNNISLLSRVVVTRTVISVCSLYESRLANLSDIDRTRRYCL